MDRRATSEDVAAALHVGPATVRRYAREGRIPFDQTPGRHRRYDIAEVRDALGADSTGTAADTRTGNRGWADAIETPPVFAPSRHLAATVQVRKTHRPPVTAHGTAADHEAWAAEIEVV